jgi:ribonuclease R
MGKKKSKEKKHKKHSTGGGTYRGTLDVTRSGMGYVVVEGLEEDILVRPSDFKKAFHGDTVEVEITSTNKRSGRYNGLVTKVLERRQSEYMGLIEVTTDFAFFTPDSDKPMPDFFIPVNALNGAKDGDRVVVRMVSWQDTEKNPKGAVITVLDTSDQNDLAMKDILMQRGFPLYFEDDTLEEAERIPEVIAQDQISRRRDMRDVLTFTIDPVDARDFDDALSIREIRKGIWEIGVHIADVSHYVTPESSLDEAAYERATSVYLPDRVLPMLPEKISNELCSLRPHEDKLTFSCVFEMNGKGEVRKTWIGRTVTHSNHRFTYEDVQAIIEANEGHYSKEILLLNEMAQRFRKERFKRGAINFSSQEVRFRLDDQGKPIGIVVKESKESHQLIEEFMLLANRTVAERVAQVNVDKKALPFPYRVHDRPDDEKLLPFVAFARKFGHPFDTKTPSAIAASFNSMLAAVRGQPEQHVLEQLGIRTMAKAAYTTENIGHYGLGFEHYCHFTSPIRRYPDIQVHRILQDVLDGQPQVIKKLEQQCRHCSERERAAMEAERAANKYKQVEFMRQYIGDEFDAVISGVASFGFWAETVEHKCEGLVSLLSLQDYDEFRHIEADYCLVGRRGGWKFRMGDKVRIKVISANLGKRQLDYEWVLQPEVSDTKPTSKRRKKRDLS